MGQKEVLEVVARLNDRLNRPASKKEIAEESGISFASTGRVLAKLKRWGDIELKDNIIKKGVEFRYSVPESVREKIGV
jgi:DNA-directed RNA polymerase specialized sigma subunit